MVNIKIIGSGSKLPKKKLDNSFFEKTVNKTDDWIVSKTGIKSRYIIDSIEEYINIIVEASTEALINSNLKPSEINLLILSTSTPTSLFGGASHIANLINIDNAISFDITLACNGFIVSFLTAYQYIKNGTCKNALIIGADCLSRWVNWSDYKTSILFGDGVGAVVLGINTDIEYGVIEHIIRQANNKHDILSIKLLDNKNIVNGENVMNSYYEQINMNGFEVSNFVLSSVPKLINDLLEKCNIKIDDLKYIIPHQANKKLLEKLEKILLLPENKLLTNVEEYGNTSSASIPILLDEIIKKKMLKTNDIILLLGFGAGMSCGAILIKYN